MQPLKQVRPGNTVRKSWEIVGQWYQLGATWTGADQANAATVSGQVDGSREPGGPGTDDEAVVHVGSLGRVRGVHQ